MRRFLPLLGAVVIAACQDAANVSGTNNEPAPAMQVVGSQSAVPDVVPGAVIAKFEPGADVTSVASAYGLSIAGNGYKNAFTILRGAIGSERALAARLAGDSRVIWAEPDYTRVPNVVDPKLWAFYNPGGLTMDYTTGPNSGSPVTSLTSKADADEDNVDNAYAAGGTDVVIGSIDTGVQFSHPEFSSGQLIAGKDWYDDDDDPSDENGHGTHTTGTMAGSTVGVAGVSGAGPHVKVYVQRVCGPRFCSSSAMASAIMAATDYPGMVAMNVSIGGSSESSAEADAIAYATSHDVLVIASAGNGGTATVDCPACDPNAISVAASDWLDEHAYYTSYGAGLDLIAPGGELYSNTTEEGGIYSSYLGGGYRYLQGTSMAAPQVTGTAAIVASKTTLRGADLRDRLQTTADDLGAGGYDTNFGWGRLNSYRAVTGSTPPGEPTGGGQVLLATFSYRCSGPTCNFDGSSSSLATTYDWTFGDGGADSGATVSHTYAAAGAFEVKLAVTDGNGGSDDATQTVTCLVRGKGLRCR
jgi:serine protease